MRLLFKRFAVLGFTNFVNKQNFNLRRIRMSSPQTLSFNEYDAFGFDIDHTLARYNLENQQVDCYMAMAQFLVKKKNYSPDILQYDRDFCTRGLVLDMDSGDFLKLAEDGTILRASHGTRAMSDSEIKSCFGDKKHWKHFEELVDSVNNIGDRFRIFENFFDMPTGVICAKAIDDVDRKAGGRADCYNYWQDVLDAINHVYHPKQFQANKGDFFPKYKENTGHYIERCSDRLKTWLKKLKEENKALFVVTSSHCDFAKTTLEYILGNDWRSYFDIFITLAKKPGFFANNRPFLQLDGVVEKEPVSDLKRHEFYSQGNSSQLVEFLAKITNKENPKVLFFGDSMRSDISPAKKLAGWDTVLILEEMETELVRSPTGRSNCELNSSSDEPPQKKSKTFENMPAIIEPGGRWGSLFTDDGVAMTTVEDNRRYMNTLWGYIIRKYADVTIPRIDCVTDFPLDHKFEVFNHKESHQWGFYPRIPDALRDRRDS